MEQTWADTRTRTMHMSDLTYVPVPVQFSRDIYRYPNQKNRKFFFSETVLLSNGSDIETSNS